MTDDVTARFAMRRQFSALRIHLNEGYAEFNPAFVLMVEPDRPASVPRFLIEPYPALLAVCLWVPRWECTAASGPEDFLPGEGDPYEPVLAWELTLPSDFSIFTQRADMIPSRRLAQSIYQLVIEADYIARVRPARPGEYEEYVKAALAARGGTRKRNLRVLQALDEGVDK